MTDYEVLRINPIPCSADITDLLADALAEVGYESFVADKTGLTAYIQADLFDIAQAEQAIAEVPFELSVSLSHHTEKGRDWNEEWEKNYFQPIVIGDKCSVRSSFHPKQDTEIEIIIDPRMAFGTGHHSTTSQMMRYLLGLDLENKSVIDMGTGTGILSILASLRGASKVTGIEIDPGAADNARDNVRLNHTALDILTGDARLLEELSPADVFLANINRNVILADLRLYAEKVKTGGLLLLSGFYTEDIPLVKRACETKGFVLEEESEDQNWSALKFRKTDKAL